MTFLMTIEKVVRFKGTILIGMLDTDVEVSEEVEIHTANGPVQSRIFAIDRGNKLVSEAKKGDGVAMMFQRISDCPIAIGDKIYKTSCSTP